jgi:hypothetical protein
LEEKMMPHTIRSQVLSPFLRGAMVFILALPLLPNPVAAGQVNVVNPGGIFVILPPPPPSPPQPPSFGGGGAPPTSGSQGGSAPSTAAVADGPSASNDVGQFGAAQSSALSQFRSVSLASVSDGDLQIAREILLEVLGNLAAGSATLSELQFELARVEAELSQRQ